jgi:hypothetical protein
MDRPEVKAFVEFFTRHSEALAAEAGSIPLNSRLYTLVHQRALRKVEGSLFEGANASGRSLEQLLDQ